MVQPVYKEDRTTENSNEFGALDVVFIAREYIRFLWKVLLCPCLLTGLIAMVFVGGDPLDPQLARLPSDELQMLHDNLAEEIATTYGNYLKAKAFAESVTSEYWFASWRLNVRKMAAQAWEKYVDPISAQLQELEKKYAAIERVILAQNGFTSPRFRNDISRLYVQTFRVASQGMLDMFTTEVRIGYYYPDLNAFVERSRFNIFTASATIGSNNSSSESKDDASWSFILLTVIYFILSMLITSTLWLSWHATLLMLNYSSSFLSTLMILPALAVIVTVYWILFYLVGAVIIWTVMILKCICPDSNKEKQN